MGDSIEEVGRDILACRRCPRLNAWRAETAAHPPRRFEGEKYHALPVPGFGDPEAKILIVGLAPAAHGANRTGRMFTGDRSGDWLYGALHRAGLANRGESRSANDGLRLRSVFITAICRCAPPDNKPTRDEKENCRPFLDREMELLWPRLKVVVALGSMAYVATATALLGRGVALPRPRPKFGHGHEVALADKPLTVLMSYHPSQQNTFTGRLTRPMFDAVWSRASELIR